MGPVRLRPRRLELAWHSVESNEFGLDEFIRWAAKAGVEPMLAVNLGTRGVAEALDVLEYMNFPSGTALSDLRVAHGAVAPYGVRMWCLGNEMDGPWQIGHKTAAEYGRLAAETGRAMRMVDPGLELVACGSSSSSMPTFGSWESTVLELAYDQVDYISAHAYYEPFGDDLDSFLASGVDLDHFIESVVATADAVRARLGRSKRINLSFDEWNVWRQSAYAADGSPTDWSIAPRVIEDEYDVADAVVVGSLLISLLRHCDQDKAACLAQLVNVIAPIRSEPGGPAWRQTIFHPFALTARHARGEVLQVRLDCPTIETRRHGPAPVIDAVATVDDGQISVFVVNRHQHEQVSVQLATGAFGELQLVEELTICDEDLNATNTAAPPRPGHPTYPRHHHHRRARRGHRPATRIVVHHPPDCRGPENLTCRPIRLAQRASALTRATCRAGQPHTGLAGRVGMTGPVVGPRGSVNSKQDARNVTRKSTAAAPKHRDGVHVRSTRTSPRITRAQNRHPRRQSRTGPHQPHRRSGAMLRVRR